MSSAILPVDSQPMRVSSPPALPGPTSEGSAIVAITLGIQPALGRPERLAPENEMVALIVAYRVGRHNFVRATKLDARSSR
jgi:hypothetical protein